jgi:hypothetical protein
MDRSQSKNEVERITTTIGELIEAVTEIALQAGKTEQEGYKLASLTIETILRRNHKPESMIM